MLIRLQDVIDALHHWFADVGFEEDRWWNSTHVLAALRELPSAGPEITDVQAIKHLQATGWMQQHDKEMYEMGLRENLADDSGSYDSLLEPEIIRCKECKYQEECCRCIRSEGRRPDDFCSYAERREE